MTDKKGISTSFDRLPNKEAESHFNQKSLITSAEFANFKAYQHALAFTVAGIADKDMLTEVHKAVKSAIDNGTSFNDFKKSLKPFLISKGWLSPMGDDKTALKGYEQKLNRRLNTIYHTNKQTAYAAGRWERIQKTKDFLPFLQYLPSASVNKRDEHKAYYGIVRHADDPIWQSIYPPNGFGCKCAVKQITKSKAERLGITDDDRIAELPTPDFDSNFDRLGSLLRLAEDKHGKEFAELLKNNTINHTAKLLHEQAKKAEPIISKDIGVKGVVRSQKSLFNNLMDKLKTGLSLDKAINAITDKLKYWVLMTKDKFQALINKLLGLDYVQLDGVFIKDGVVFELYNLANWLPAVPKNSSNVLSDVEFAVLYHYTGNGYKDLNKYLRNKLKSPSKDTIMMYETARAVLNEALHKLPNYEGVVIRRTDLTDEQLSLISVGNILTFDAFTSTTATQNKDVIISEKHANVRFVMTVQTGTHIKQFSKYPNENEVLMGSPTQYFVKNRRDLTDTFGYIEFELIEINNDPR